MPEQKPQQMQPRELMEYGLVGAYIYAVAFYPFLRKGQGRYQPGIYGGLCLVCMWSYAVTYRCTAILYLIGLWIIALIWWRLTMDRSQHSMYQGRPRVAALPPIRWIKDPYKKERAAQLAECFLCLGLGWWLHPYSPPLGNFVMGGCFCLGYIYIVTGMMDQREQIALNDAYVEAGRYRR